VTLDDLLRVGEVKRGTETDCWRWRGAHNDDGYGQPIRYQGRRRKPHVVALMLKLDRELAPGMQANHSCDVRDCVNVSHVYEGTQRQNVLDAVERGRWTAQADHVREAGMKYRERARQTD
jgi:hypothetical protein